MIKPCTLRIIRENTTSPSTETKLLFIAIPIGPQPQQVNVTPNSVRSRMRSFQDQMSNSLYWKTISPNPFSLPWDALVASLSGSSYIT